MSAVLRVAGSDTREAFATPTVRAAAMGALLGSGPAIASTFTVASAWEDILDFRGTGVWLTPLMIVAGVGTAIAAWRFHVSEARSATRSTPALEPAFVLAAAGALAAAAGDARLIAVSMPVAVIVSAVVVAGAAGIAVRACVAGIASAASGIVVACALAGIVPALHVMMVGAGSGLPRAAGWSAAYFALAGIMLARAHRALPRDRARIAMRTGVPADPLTTTTDPAALDCRGIRVRFGPNVILDGADLTVHAGELVALVGANGAGKSTILRVAAGFVPIERGRVSVGDEDVTMLRPEERASAGLSFVSGARPVFPDLTILQNLRAAAYATHKTARAFDQATGALFDLIPTLAQRKDRRAGVLSGGEQRLLAVAQTLYRRPKVLLADELTLGLDHDARLAVMDLLQLLAREGVAVIAVDHDLPSLLPRSDRVALVADTQITSFDDPLEILRRRTDLLPATFLAGVQ